MRNILATSAILATANAIGVEQVAAPDVYGPNGANYTNVSPYEEFSRIKIDITKKGDGKGGKNERCRDGQWAKISYKGFLKNGQQILDTDVDGEDLIFSVGASQTFKCFDLAITQLKPGAIAHIECPSDLVYGGASVQAKLGGDWIPKWSDVDFDIEVKWCNHNPGDQGAGLYWGDDLSFWTGPKDLTPGSCIRVNGIDRTRYWVTPNDRVKTQWYCETEWGPYCGTWVGPIDAGLEAIGGYDFKVVEGLSGKKGSVSFVPKIGAANGAYMYIHQWNYMTFGTGSNDEFKNKATFIPELNPTNDGTWTLKVEGHSNPYFNSKKMVSYWGLFFSDSTYYSTVAEGNAYYMKA